MRLIARFFCFFILQVTISFTSIAFAATQTNIPILCYHNFSPTVPGSMNMTPQQFETQLIWLNTHGFTVIPLKEAVEFLQGKRASLPPKSIVITVDDGWQSVYTYLYPIVKKYQIPVTLFIFSQTISVGKNALTWDELKELQNTGLFDIQGHTDSHPNFKVAKKSFSTEKYNKFVTRELEYSKKILEKKLGHPIIFLAWPFGIYNSDLEDAAQNAGYTMAFTIDARTAKKSDRAMAEPRFMIIASQSMKTFQWIVNGVK
jgi:peptidoglycan/xylan/chitin deacetylase (PgdA/CDA1 family)